MSGSGDSAGSGAGGGERSVSAPIGGDCELDRIWERNRPPRWIGGLTGVCLFGIGERDRVGSVNA